MKRLVKIVQLSILVAMSYPVAVFWENNNVDTFCMRTYTGMDRDVLIESLKNTALKTQFPQVEHAESARWHALVISRLPFSDYQCEIRGVAQQVISARIYKNYERL